MLIISAVLQAKEGSGDEMEKVIKTFAPRFLQDPGCIEYRPHRRLDNPNVFFFFEKYENDEALKFHSSSDNFKEMSKAMAGLVAAKPEIGMYKEI